MNFKEPDILATELIPPQQRAWNRFKADRRAYISMWLLLTMIGLSVCAPYIANHKPLARTLQNDIIYSPTINNDNKAADGRYIEGQVNWVAQDYDFVIWPLVTYSPGMSDKRNNYLNAKYQSPFADQKMQVGDEVRPLPKRFWHWCGTGKKGEDVLAGVLHGGRTSLSIGVFAMIISVFIGIPLGLISGFYGDDQSKVSIGGLIGLGVGLFVGWFYGVDIRAHIIAEAFDVHIAVGLLHVLMSIAIVAGCICCFGWLGVKFLIKGTLSNQISLPWDAIISRFTETVVAIPKMVLIIALTALISTPSVLNIIVIIGFTSWTSIARLMRVEVLRIKELNFVESARALGITDFQIAVKHILPNAIGSVSVVAVFTISNVILIESSLSFLGIGVPIDHVTWGSMLNEGREYFSAWWLVLYPGLAIFITITCINLVGDGIRNALNWNAR